MQEIFRTSLLIDTPKGELRLILITNGDSRWLNLEVYHDGVSGQADTPVRQVTLPLSLWPRFHEAVCCLGTYMKPLPAPAYQARSCCSYVCPRSPGTVVLRTDSWEEIHLSLQDRRGSTFLEIKSLKLPGGNNSGEAQTIRLGPTVWSSFLSELEKLNQILADF